MRHLERRSAPRERLSLPVTMGDGSTAVTRDIGPGGIYLDVHPGCPIAAWLTLEFDDPHARLRFRATGEVLRVEADDATIGLALRLHGARLLPLS